jgi:hypothetical protein
MQHWSLANQLSNTLGDAQVEGLSCVHLDGFILTHWEQPNTKVMKAKERSRAAGICGAMKEVTVSA